MKKDKKVIFIDIDETICLHPQTDPGEPRDYEKAVPIKENIKKANKLYDEGHTIVYWTARGSVTGKDWTDLTNNQLDSWGVKYHEIRLGKPYYDIFIDDKALNVGDWV